MGIHPYPIDNTVPPTVGQYPQLDTSSAVEVVQLKGNFSEPVPASVEAREAGIISSRLLARITTIEVRAGDYVEAGQLLRTLESTDL